MIRRADGGALEEGSLRRGSTRTGTGGEATGAKMTGQRSVGARLVMAESDIAVIGMACRYPGRGQSAARSGSCFATGREGSVEFSEDALRSAGVPDVLLAGSELRPRAACRSPIWPSSTPASSVSRRREASIMDPQHRHFLECVWEAFEDAGHDPHRFDGAVGVFAGSGMNTYLIHNLITNPDLVESVGWFLLRHTEQRQGLPRHTRLVPASIFVVRASTSRQPARPRWSRFTRPARACCRGSATSRWPVARRSMPSRTVAICTRRARSCPGTDTADRSTRSSDGTVFGNGAGVVVLRRLDDALADGDHVRAVIKGSAVNNDGARKVGYLAPSVDGHAEVGRRGAGHCRRRRR